MQEYSKLNGSHPEDVWKEVHLVDDYNEKTFIGNKKEYPKGVLYAADVPGEYNSPSVLHHRLLIPSFNSHK